jgi:hypothetical protein
MIDKDVAPRITASGAAYQRAAMSAAVYACRQNAICHARHNNRRVPEKRALEVVRLGDLGFHGNEAPDRSTKDPFLLKSIDLR